MGYLSDVLINMQVVQCKLNRLSSGVVNMLKMPLDVLVNLILLNKDAPKESSVLCLEQSVFRIETRALFIEYRVGRQTL